MAAASFLQSTTAQPAHSSQSPSSRGVRFPAWAFARRISNNRSTGCQDTNNPKDSFSKIRQLQHHVRQAAAQGQASQETVRHEIVTQTTLDTVSSAESQAATQTTQTTSNPSEEQAQMRLQLDVTGVSGDDLRVHVDTWKKQLVVSGRGPRMFKRSYPLPSNTNPFELKVFLTQSESGGQQRQHLTLVEQRSGRQGLLADHPSNVVGERCYNLCILPQETH